MASVVPLRRSTRQFRNQITAFYDIIGQLDHFINNDNRTKATWKRAIKLANECSDYCYRLWLDYETAGNPALAAASKAFKKLTLLPHDIYVLCHCAPKSPVHHDQLVIAHNKLLHGVEAAAKIGLGI